MKMRIPGIALVCATAWLAGATLMAQPIDVFNLPQPPKLLDVGDDPENQISGAPVLDWNFYGNRMHTIMKWYPGMPAHRDLGIDYKSYYFETDTLTYQRNSSIDKTITDSPLIPNVICGKLGKIERNDGESPKIYTQSSVDSFKSRYSNVIWGGGVAPETDGVPVWMYPQYYGVPPTGKGGRRFPTIWHDSLEDSIRRSAGSYLSIEHNEMWSPVLTGEEQASGGGAIQLFYRSDHSIAGKATAYRSAYRAYPEPYRVQFSGQVGVNITNLTAVQNSGATPIYEAVSPIELNYGKSYALNRQMLYYAWLQGARLFMYESMIFVNNDGTRPSPLAMFEKSADALMGQFGQPGPVDTPVAIMGEATNSWKTPNVTPTWTKTVEYRLAGLQPYEPGDHQMLQLRDFIMPGLINCENIFMNGMMETNALPPTPYGDCADYLSSNIRDQALARYNLLIWGGIPPETPSIVREKFDRHINQRGGRVVVFGAAAKAMYPELFTNSGLTVVPTGSTVTYGAQNFTETPAFSIYQLSSTAGMQVLATVSGNPLIVDKGGLVIVLSDYGMNRNSYTASTATVSYTPDVMFTNHPFKLLTHATKLLQNEVGACTPFRVGNNNLHYIVNRRAPGTYVISLFNDKMTSEPFTITSAIGTITGMQEVPLNDNKAALKAAANGACYAPPGLRSSPSLPLNYGLSDASNIEGRDFRMFVVTVNETVTRTFPNITYPPRPAARVLAVSGLDNIRRYIQSLPDFFQIFDGIKVNAAAMATIEDGRVGIQARYLKRRNVRVVLDGEGAPDATIITALGKMALITSSNKTLIKASPSAGVQSAATSAGVTVISPTTVNRLNSLDDAVNGGSALNVLDLYYDIGDEDGLYRDWQHFRDGTALTKLHGKAAAIDLVRPLATPGAAVPHYVYLGSQLYDLGAVIQRSQAAFDLFLGVQIDADYLLNKTPAQLAADKAVLDSLGLKLIVDMRRQQSAFDGIFWYTYLPYYTEGTAQYTSIVNKMQTFGSTELIVSMNEAMHTATAEVNDRNSTLASFRDQASTRGINLHLVIDNGQTTSITSSSNVFVMKGGGTASPFTIVDPTGRIGTGTTLIYLQQEAAEAASSGAGIYLNAAMDDGNNTKWEDVLGIWSPTINTGVIHVPDAGSAFSKITAAYDFPGGISGNGGCDGVSFQSLSGAVDTKRLSIEMWFKPTTSATYTYPANGQVLWETGGATGLGIFYRDGFVEVAHDANSGRISTDVSALTGEFIQVVVTYDPTITTNNFKLYINGVLKITANRTDSDWSSTDGSGLGNRGSSEVGGAGTGDNGTESFKGKIAIFRAYFNRILTSQEIEDKFADISVSFTPGFTISAISGNTTEAGGTATFTVRLNSQPTANVVLGLSSSDTTEGAVAPASLTFTNANWNTNQTVTVTGVDDAIVDGTSAYSVVTAAVTSTDINYSGVNPADVALANADNETAGFTLSKTTSTVAENGGTDTFTVVLATRPASDVVFSVASSATGDATVSPATLTFTTANWNTTQVVTVTGVNDNSVATNTATVTVSVVDGSSDDNWHSLADKTVAVTCTNDDVNGAIELSSPSYFVNESAGTLDITVQRTGGSIGAVGVSYATANGTATAGSDYTAASGTLSWAAGDSSAKTISIPITLDASAESDETLTVALSALSGGAVFGSPSSGVVTIYDTGTVTMSTSDATSSEPSRTDGNGSFTITRTGSLYEALTVPYAMTGTATNGSDYALLSGTAVIPVGSTSVVVPVTITNDTVLEANETAIMTLQTGAGYTLGATVTGTVTLRDDEPCTVSVAVTDSDCQETSSNDGVYTITRLGNAAAAITVNYGMSGTSANGTDYAALGGTAAIGANANTVTVAINTTDDSTYESTETAILTLATGTGYAIGTPANATISIIDNDKPTIAVTATDGIATEAGPTTATYTFTRSNDVVKDAITVYYAVTGTATAYSDYQALSGSVVIPAGQDTATVMATPIDDTLNESAETVIVTISANGAYTVGGTAATATISDNEIQVVTVSATDNSASEPGRTDGNGVFTFTRVGDTTADLVVNYVIGGTAVNGSDYTSLSGTVTIPAGQSSATETVVATDDTEFEINETVILNLAPGTGYAIGHYASNAITVTIRDDDASIVTVAATDADARELAAANAGTYTITRTGSLASAITVNYTMTGTAANGTDYTNLTGSVSIAANTQTGTVTLTPTEDALSEGDETATMTLSAGTGYTVGTPASSTITIADGELPIISFGTSDLDASEPSANNGYFRISRAGATTAVTVNYTISGTATSGSDFTAVTGSVTFPASNNSQDAVISVLDDALAEDPETVILAISPNAAYSIAGPTSQTMTLRDDENTVTLAATDANATEGGGTGTFRFTKSIAAGALAVNYTLTGTATNGTDYTYQTGSITIPNGQTFADLVITANDDFIYDPDETVIITLAANGTAYSIGTAAGQTLTIAESDSRPAVHVFASDSTASESPSTTGFFTLCLSKHLPANTAVAYSVSGTATNGTDCTALSGSVTFNAGVLEQRITVTPTADGVTESPETLTVSVIPGVSYVAGTPSSSTVVISDDDNPTAVPEMQVLGAELADQPINFGDNTPSITDGTDFATVDASGYEERTFTIVNSGAAALNLTGTPKVAISGDTAFTVVSQPATPVAASGGMTTFTIRCAPGSIGLKTATVSIASNDSDENPYTFAVKATGKNVVWFAYHDMNNQADTGSDHPNITKGSTHGTAYALKDISSGVSLTPQIQFKYYTNAGAENAALLKQNATATTPDKNPLYGDAYADFSGVIDMAQRSFYLTTSPAPSSDYALITFTGLNPAQKYSVSLFHNRGATGADVTRYTLQNATLYIAAGSEGIGGGSDSDVADEDVHYGQYNTIAGDLARWDAIVPTGTSLTIRVECQAGANFYLPTGIMLEESSDATSSGVVQLSSAAYSVNENGTSVTITATRTGGSTGAASVSYATSNDTATAGSDYTAASGTLNWADGDMSNKTFTVSIADDTLVEGNEIFNITLSGASGATMGAQSTATATITDNDNATAGYTLSKSTSTVAENGGTDTFTVVLSTQPTSDVVLSVGSSATGEATVSPTTLTFTNANWSVAQTVTVTGVNDSSLTTDSATITIGVVDASSDNNWDPLADKTVAVSCTNDDTASFVVGAVSRNTTEAGGTATFTVRLGVQPSANVTFGLSSSDTTEGAVSPASLTFTTANWNVDQTITVSGVDDMMTDGDIAYDIVTAAAVTADADYSGLDPADVAVTNTDDDTAGFALSKAVSTVAENGGTDTFTAVLTAQPANSVVFNVTSSATGEATVSPATLTFTAANWNTAQTVTITGVNDDTVTNDSATVTLSVVDASSDNNWDPLANKTVAVTCTNDDTVGFAMGAISGNTTEAGGTATFTVKLNTVPTANVSIALSSSDLTEGTVSPASLTFTTANWNTNQTVTVTGVDDATVDGNMAYSIATAAAVSTDGNYSALNPADVAATNTDNDYVLTISNDGNGTTDPAGASDRTMGTAVAISATASTGYHFVNWTAVSGTPTFGDADQSSTTVAASAAATIRANFAPDTYTVTYNANGGTTPNPTTQIVTFDSTYATLATTTRSGYTFDGWFTAASGGTRVEAGTTVTTAGDHALYAQWTVIPPEVILFADDFNAANGISLTDPASRATGTLASTVKYAFNSTTGVIVNGMLSWDDNNSRDTNHEQTDASGTQNLRIMHNWAPQVAGKIWEVEFKQRVGWSHPLTFGLSDNSQTGLWSAWDSANYDFAVGSYGVSLRYDFDNQSGTNLANLASIFPSPPNTTDTQHIRIRFDEPAGITTVWINGVIRVQTTGLDFENTERYLTWGEPNNYGGAIDDLIVRQINYATVASFTIAGIPAQATVGSPVTGITITAKDDANQTATSFTGTVTFGGTAGITGTSANFVAGVLSGVSVTPTSVGAGLTFTVDDGASHTGSASFDVQTVFANWSGGASVTADANNDGVANGLAWLFGAANPSVNAIALQPTFDNTTDADYFIYTYRRSDSAFTAAGTTSAVEYGSTLVSWTTAVHDGTNIIITPANDFYGTGVDKVEVKIKKTLAIGGKLFARTSLLTN